MALELEMVGLVLDGWPGFIVKDRDMQLLWDIYRQPQVAIDFVGDSFESIFVDSGLMPFFFVILAGCFCPNDLQKNQGSGSVWQK